MTLSLNSFSQTANTNTSIDLSFASIKSTGALDSNALVKLQQSKKAVFVKVEGKLFPVNKVAYKYAESSLTSRSKWIQGNNATMLKLRGANVEIVKLTKSNFDSSKLYNSVSTKLINTMQVQ